MCEAQFVLENWQSVNNFKCQENQESIESNIIGQLERFNTTVVLIEKFINFLI